MTGKSGKEERKDYGYYIKANTLVHAGGTFIIILIGAFASYLLYEIREDNKEFREWQKDQDVNISNNAQKHSETMKAIENLEGRQDRLERLVDSHQNVANPQHHNH